MEEQIRFKIVFEKIAEAHGTGTITEIEMVESVELCVESEEIAELRRIVSEISDPEPKSYTTT